MRFPCSLRDCERTNRPLIAHAVLEYGASFLVRSERYDVCLYDNVTAAGVRAVRPSVCVLTEWRCEARAHARELIAPPRPSPGPVPSGAVSRWRGR